MLHVVEDVLELEEDALEDVVGGLVAVGGLGGEVVVAVGERLQLGELGVEGEDGAGGARHRVDEHVLARVVHVEFEEGGAPQLLLDHLHTAKRGN